MVWTVQDSSSTQRVNQGHPLNPQFPSQEQKLFLPLPTPLLGLGTNLLNPKRGRDYCVESRALPQNCMEKGMSKEGLELADPAQLLRVDWPLPKPLSPSVSSL